MEDANPENILKIIPLGGLGEIGLNMMVMEYGDSMIVVDAGLMFPEEHMPGVDIVIPDAGYVIRNRHKLKAFFITHGHEDHIGALPFILKEAEAPVYGTAMTIGLIEEKLKEFSMIGASCLETVRPRDTVSAGDFEVEFIRVSHSIVDGCALAIKTPVGVCVHTGDFKLDQTPVDNEVLDYARFAQYGEKGVLLLMSDSTNVEKEGFTLSEREIGANLEDIFGKTSGRIIVAAFSSNIHRIQQVLNAADKFGRKVVLNGKSMVANVRIASALGYINAPEGLMVDIKELQDLPPQRVVLLTTGSQGEPMSALTRMSLDDHKHLKILKGDTVILSSKLIPGHEKAITTMMNHLYKRGATVIYEKVSEVHVSGHASQEELKIMLNMVRPKYFLPVHGEFRHLVMHADLAKKTGIPEQNIIVAEDGDVVEFSAEGWSVKQKIETGRIFVDGKGVGDVSEVVLKDRRHLSQDGMVLAVMAINSSTGEPIYGPDIITRGLVLEAESPGLIEGAKAVVLETLANLNKEARTEEPEVKEEIRRALRKFFNKRLERRPVILPVIIEM